MMDNQLMRQLRYNVERLVGEYLNGQMDYGEEEYPNLTKQEWLDYCIPEIYNIKDNGLGSTWYGEGICDELKFLGNDKIHELILYTVDAEGLLAE